MKILHIKILKSVFKSLKNQKSVSRADILTDLKINKSTLSRAINNSYLLDNEINISK